MNMPTSLPDWLPWWAVLLVVLPLALYLLAFLAMPFSVLGLKARLEGIEERLDEIQGEVRALALRLPERGRDSAVPIPPAREAPRRDPARDDRPPQDRGPDRSRGDTPLRHYPAPRPAPPPEYDAADDHDDPPPPPPRPASRPPIPMTQRPRRNEPRLDWPG